EWGHAAFAGLRQRRGRRIDPGLAAGDGRLPRPDHVAFQGLVGRRLGAGGGSTGGRAGSGAVVGQQRAGGRRGQPGHGRPARGAVAVEEAGGFVRKREIDFDQYLKLYAESRRTLLAQHALGSTQYPDPVAIAWTTTINRLGPLPRAILRLAAFLAPDKIPVS